MHDVSFEIAETLAGIDPAGWDALAGGNPTLSHAFLQSLIDAGCTTAATGWLPQFLLMRRAGAPPGLAGAVPLYLKGHSYGEYVFDWSWAEAWQRAGHDYYPKLTAAVPFTPCTGSRLLAATPADRGLLLEALLSFARQAGVSSLHVLFPAEDEHALLVRAGLMARSAVQFHWANAGYRTFDDFLSTLSHDKRKKIRQERRRVREAGIALARKTGADIREEDWDFFTRCYRNTYRAHFSTPYLNRDFFRRLGEKMPGQVMMVVASRAGNPIAAALNLGGGGVLYGRYWGAVEAVPNLHFEACYYQALEFCIERGIALFEGGAQGAHKHSRGFLPVKCRSAHWIADEGFAAAVADFLRREDAGIDTYVDELAERSPYRADPEAKP